MNLAIAILRFGMGIMFLAHGLQMAFGLFKGPGIAGFAKMLPPLFGFPALFWSYLASYTCLIGGICLLLGLFMKLAIIPLGIFMVTAVALVHWKNGFFITAGGWEYNFIILCALAALFFLGSDSFCITKKL
ncbi:MAG: DoxX family protein [Candidatus Omnitrophica bacterium]|nr:DoxX family protein [Candidatus Omnitrophota bacterium]